MDHMGELVAPLLVDLTVVSTKEAIPRNTLHRFICLHLILPNCRRRKGFVSRKAYAVLASSAEVVIDAHLTADRYSEFCKGTGPNPFAY